MRLAHSVAQVRAAEDEVLGRLADQGLPPDTLMQRAASGLAYAVADFLGTVYGRRVRLLVGSGNNGGDALYAGAVLARRGAQVEAVLISPEGVHKTGLAALLAAGGRVWRSDDSPGIGAAQRTNASSRCRDRRDRRNRGSRGTARRSAAGPEGLSGCADRGCRCAERRRRRHRRGAWGACSRRSHGDVRHLQSGASGGSGRCRRAASWNWSIWGCRSRRRSRSASRRRCRSAVAEGRSGRAQVQPWSRRAADRFDGVSGCGGAVGRRSRMWAWRAWFGTSARLRTAYRLRIRRSWSVLAGCRPGSSARAVGATPRPRLKASLADGVPVVVDADALTPFVRTRAARRSHPPSC